MNSNVMRSLWGMPPKLPRNTGWPKELLREVILFDYKKLKMVSTDVNMRIAVDYGCRDELLHWGDCNEFKYSKDMATIRLKPTSRPVFAEFEKRPKFRKCTTPYSRPPTPMAVPELTSTESIKPPKPVSVAISWANIAKERKKGER